MRATGNAGLTDNAWTTRIQELRQIVSDNYEPQEATPSKTTRERAEEFVGWLMSGDVDTEFDIDDELELLDITIAKIEDYRRR